MATFTGMRSEDAVTSSWAVIWKQPSPSTAHTMRSGRPTLAPMEAGTAKPMVPSPLVLTHARHHDRVVRCVVPQLLDHELGLEDAVVVGLLVGQGVLGLPGPQLGHPRAPVGLGRRSPGGLHRVHQLLYDEPAVA